MKKIVLFFLMLLPCLGFSQNASELLVRWEGTRFNWSAPTTVPVYYYNNAGGTFSAPAGISAANITGSNISFHSAEQYNGFFSTNWPSGAMDNSKYYQVAITAGTGKKIELKNFKFKYGEFATGYKIIYQKVTGPAPSDAAFANGSLLANVNNAVSGTTISHAFPSAYFVQPGETVYLRIYAYGVPSNNNKWFIKHINGDGVNQVPDLNSPGPAFYGTVSAAGGVTAVADVATTYESTTLTKNVIENDLFDNTTLQSLTITSQPSNGSASVSGNNIVFVPGNTTGERIIGYKITGADGSTSTSTLTVTVNPYPNPVASNDTYTTGQLIPVAMAVTANDDLAGGTLSNLNVVTSPGVLSGVTTVVGNTIVFTPAPTCPATVTITYKIKNSNNKWSNNATVTINVVPVTAIIAQNDVMSTVKNTAVTVPVLANDILGNSPLSTLQIVSNAAHGNAVVNALTQTITYTPANGYTGTDSFTYKVTDLYNTTSTAVVNMTVLQPTATGPLCGTYVISSVPQAIYPQFTTISAAISHLNTHGVTCPVTFLLMDTNYSTETGENFPLVINQFNGTSTTNTVTFKPGYLKNVTIKVNDKWINSTNYQAASAFILNGADNIIFDGSYNNNNGNTTRNLTVFNNNTLDYNNRAVFWVAANGNNGAKNITIKHVNIKQGYRNQGGKYTLGVFSGNNYIENAESINNRSIKVEDQAGADNSNLIVWNNKFINVKQGVYINGGSTATTQTKISQNEFGAEDNNETCILPIAINNATGFNVTENMIYNLFRNTTDGDLVAGGILIKGNSTGGSVTKNNLRKLERLTEDQYTFAGIVLQANAAQSNILIANNFILDVIGKGNSGSYSNGYGIITDTGGGYRIIHNTIVLSKNQPNGGYSAALFVNAGVGNLDVRNNIFVNTQTNPNTRRTAITVKNDVDNLNAIFTHLDYNDYYSLDKVGYIANVEPLKVTWPENPDYMQSFDQWQGALANSNNAMAGNRDAHSINFNPVFLSATDLHLGTANGTMDNKGTYISEVGKDIDGQKRSTSTPDVGADEFGGVVTPAPGSNDGIYCDSSTTWNGTTWSNGYPSAEKDVIFRANMNVSAETMYACSIYVENGAVVNFNTYSNAIVTHNVNVKEGSSLTFESSSNLIQIENAQNYGNVTVKRASSKLKRLDYTLWSSPVTGTQSLLQFSPNTLTNRFYTYNTLTNYYTPQEDPSAVTFTKAKGYLIRMPNNHPSGFPSSWTGAFYGTPNNGDVYAPLVHQSNTIAYNAVGNPYPSPISVAAFIDANIDNIEGTLWIWRKTNDWTQTSYSTVTKAGYVANAAPGGGSTDNDLVADPFEILPDVGALNTGQGFIVQAKTSQNLVFRNNMRVPNNFAYFFRTEQDMSAPAVPAWTRVWINVKNPAATQDFSQIMIGYSNQTSLAYDNGFDGKALDGGNLGLSSIISENGEQMLLALQARPAFTQTDVVPLSFKADIAGTFEFSIDRMDGLFETTDQAIYLIDNETGAQHNLREGSYSFTTGIGTFNNRFRVVYAAQQELGTEMPVVEPQSVIVFRDQNKVSINSPQDIKSVAVYDMLGRLLYENGNVAASEFTTPEITTAQQVVIVKIALDNQQVISKKIMMN